MHDGDTVRLSDGRKVRLLGIDTPELARKGKPAQAFALQAKQALQDIVEPGYGKVSLQTGVEKRDKYGRLLAHLFSPDGQNINASLIRQGLAIAYTTPPNTAFSECYHQVEQQARDAGRGFWTLAKYRPVKDDDLLDSDTGFHLVRFKVKTTSTSARGWWLQGKHIKVHIRKRDFANFDPAWLQALRGRTVLVRGWLHPDRYKPERWRYLQLRHPSSLQRL